MLKSLRPIPFLAALIATVHAEDPVKADVCVYGATPAGINAAIAGAKLAWATKQEAEESDNNGTTTDDGGDNGGGNQGGELEG